MKWVKAALVIFGVMLLLANAIAILTILIDAVGIINAFIIYLLLIVGRFSIAIGLKK